MITSPDGLTNTPKEKDFLTTKNELEIFGITSVKLAYLVEHFTSSNNCFLSLTDLKKTYD